MKRIIALFMLFSFLITFGSILTGQSKLPSKKVLPVKKKTKSVPARTQSLNEKGIVMQEKVEKSEEEWRKQLTPEEFYITRKGGTERAFTGRYWNNHRDGIYQCVCCGAELFSSKEKYDSGSGWPSFWDVLDPENIQTREDNSLFMQRTEVLCNRCGAHLGHLFNDGPKPTGLRYCINSAALRFIPAKKDRQTK